MKTIPLTSFAFLLVLLAATGSQASILYLTYEGMFSSQNVTSAVTVRPPFLPALGDPASFTFSFEETAPQTYQATFLGGTGIPDFSSTLTSLNGYISVSQHNPGQILFTIPAAYTMSPYISNGTPNLTIIPTIYSKLQYSMADYFYTPSDPTLVYYEYEVELFATLSLASTSTTNPLSTVILSPTPIPSAIILLGTALVGLVGWGGRSRKQDQ